MRTQPLLFVGSPTLPHRPVAGEEFMPYGWCGGCEICDRYPVPTVCVSCSFYPGEVIEDDDGTPVLWPCPHALPILEVTGGCPRSTTTR